MTRKRLAIVVIILILIVGTLLPIFSKEVYVLFTGQDGDRLKQAPGFYLGYSWNTTSETEHQSSPDATGSYQIRPTVSRNASSSLDVNETTSAYRTTTNDALSKNTSQNNSTIVSITLLYHCHSVSDYIRTEFKDLRCTFLKKESTVKPKNSVDTNNHTEFELLWEGDTPNDTPTKNVNVSMEDGKVPLELQKLALKSPSEFGEYKINATATRGQVWLARSTPVDFRENIKVTVYTQSRVATYKQMGFLRRTYPFQVLGVFILWFSGANLILSIKDSK